VAATRNSEPSLEGIPGPSLPDTVTLFGVNVSRMTYAQTLDWLERGVLRRPGARACVFSANVDQLVRCHRDPVFRETYEIAGLVVPDGMPLLWSARLLRRPLPERVTGIDLLYGLCQLASRRGHRCFLLGSREETVARAARNLAGQFPGLAVCGWHHGFLADDEEAVAAINAARAEILFVGMGSPLQETWLKRNFPRLLPRLVLPVGGAFEVLAGKRNRAPKAVQRAGMEWAWRMMQEPRRLWRRYLVEDLKFVPLVMNELRSRRAGPRPDFKPH
jgi:N-acetylglucosaminyldiphosphoundecaprenol N-acetyl-beta-D-mannosaminyltransferase